jgi:hypothetical protein
MVRKELWMDVLAYNLLRSVMATAAGPAGLMPRRRSFTGAPQAVHAFGTALLCAAATAKAARRAALYSTISAYSVGQRPDRGEPRAVKRRPKPHALLTMPRSQARKCVRQGQYAYGSAIRVFGHFALTPWHIQDPRYIDTVVALAHQGILFLFDLGYFKVKAFASLATAGAYFCCRLNHQTNIYSHRAPRMPSQ